MCHTLQPGNPASRRADTHMTQIERANSKRPATIRAGIWVAASLAISVAAAFAAGRVPAVTLGIGLAVVLAAAGITHGCNPPVNDRYCPDWYVNRGQMAAFLVRALGYTDAGGGDLFTDDDTSVFEGDIDRLGTAAVTRGCNPPVNDMYCPDRYVTRGQMAAFLHRALG